MKNKLFLLLLFLVGLINFLPVLGLFSVNQMSTGYGVDLASNELQILMRHRALLFGLLGGFVFVSLLQPIYRLPAMIMTGLSMIGFLILVGLAGDINDEIIKVTVADVVGIVCLLLAFVMQHLANND